MKKSLNTRGTAILLSVCVATALCANFVGACSADDDDIYYGDELKTRAAAKANSSGDASIFERVMINAGRMSDTQTFMTGKKDRISVELTMSWGRNPDAATASISQNVNVSVPYTFFNGISKDLYEVSYYATTPIERAVAVNDNPRTFTTWVHVSYKLKKYTADGQFVGYGTSDDERGSVTLTYTFDVTGYTKVVTP